MLMTGESRATEKGTPMLEGSFPKYTNLYKPEHQTPPFKSKWRSMFSGTLTSDKLGGSQWEEGVARAISAAPVQ
jgi:hypothetical protein